MTLYIIPKPKELPRYDYESALSYCWEHGIKISELTIEQWEQFRINP